MPRIYTSASDPIDLCRVCWPDEPAAKKKWGNVGEGPDGRGNCFGYDDAHPDYAESDYRCYKCKKLLTGRDD